MKAFIFYERLYDKSGENLLVGGIETYLLNLAQVIKDFNIEPIIIQSADCDFHKLYEDIMIEGFSVKRKNLYYNLYSKVRDRIGDNDIVIWGLDRCAVKINHERVISIQHGIPFDYYQEENKLKRSLLHIGLGKVVKLFQRVNAIKYFKRATHKVCVDYNFLNWYRTYSLPFEEENIYVIPNFANVPKQYTAKDENTKLKIVFARRFVRMRGIEVFLKVAKYYKNDSRVDITFAGEGPYENLVDEIVSSSNNIHKDKYMPDKAVEFHQQFDIAVVPSIASEGTSLSLLEAMSAGNVVICTNVGGMTNIVIDGYNGLFVRPNSHEDIIKHIETLLNDPSKRKALAVNAFNTIESSFSLEIWKRRWSKVIETVILTD